MCAVTGGEDGNVRVWDLAGVGEWEDVSHDHDHQEFEEEKDVSGDAETDEFGNLRWENVSATKSGNGSGATSPRHVAKEDGDHACLKVLEGHSKGITALYFENECLVRLVIDSFFLADVDISHNR
jgi:division protein 1